jgi:hypothetical protein
MSIRSVSWVIGTQPFFRRPFFALDLLLRTPDDRLFDGFRPDILPARVEFGQDFDSFFI